MSRTDVARIAICEDSRTYAYALRRFLEHDDDLRVVEVCASAEDLLARLPTLAVDLVTMDLGLPGLDGVAAIEQIMATDPRPILVVSAHTQRGSERAAAALTAGALETIDKLQTSFDDARSPAAVALRRRIKRLAVTRLRPSAAIGGSHAAPAASHLPGRAAAVIAVGSSTGGPRALAELLAQLPADFAVPILVAQHMSPGFTDGLARWLDGLVPVGVGVAVDGQAAGPGAWFAPSDRHLELSSEMTLRVSGAPLVGHHRPSVDMLLTSVARATGPAGVAVVLTGMGSDGAAGVAAVVAAGGVALAQDAASAVVNGMPAAAIRSGAGVVLTPAQIGATLATLRLVVGARS